MKHFAYRVDHDTGFAPNTEKGICTLSGCKKTTIEKWAKAGSWVIGIGGNNTTKPNKLIYAMEVEENLPYSIFKRKYPEKSKYLKKENAGTNVLVSRRFYYFGNNALSLPDRLKHIIIDRCGCKCVSEEDIHKLKKHIWACGYKNGVLGQPNNMQSTQNVKNIHARCRKG